MSYIYAPTLIERLEKYGLLTPGVRTIIDQVIEEEEPRAAFYWGRDDVLRIGRDKMIRPTEEEIKEILSDFESTEEVSSEALEVYFEQIVNRARPTPADVIWYLQDGADGFDGGPFETVRELEIVNLKPEIRAGRAWLDVRVNSWWADEAETERFSAPVDEHGNITWQQWRVEDDESN